MLSVTSFNSEATMIERVSSLFLKGRLGNSFPLLEQSSTPFSLYVRFHCWKPSMLGI